MALINIEQWGNRGGTFSIDLFTNTGKPRYNELGYNECECNMW